MNVRSKCSKTDQIDGRWFYTRLVETKRACEGAYMGTMSEGGSGHLLTC